MRMFRTVLLCLALLPAVAGAYTYPQLKSFRTSTAWTNEVINRINLTRVIVSMSGTPTNTTSIYIVNGSSTSLLVSTTSGAFTTAVWPVGTNAPNKYLYTGDKIVAVNSSTNFASLYLYGTDAVTNSGGGGTGNGFPLTNDVSAAGFDISGVETLTASNVVAATGGFGRVSANVSALGAAQASTLALSDGTVDEFADITTGFLTAGNGGSDPGGTRARFTLSKSGTAITLTGWLVGFTNNAAGNLFYLDPGSTGAVESLFLKSGTGGVGRLYYSDQASPNNYLWKDLPLTTTGLLMWAGTGFQFASQTNAIGTATNTILFGGADTNYWRNFASQTNLLVQDDGTAVIVGGAGGIPFLGFDGGSNVSVEIITQAWAGVTGRVARFNAGGGSGGTNGLLFSVNSWAESNTFQKAVTALRFMLSGNGNTMTGSEAQVVGGATNTASGRGSIAGGISSTASGEGAIALGIGSSALGSGSSAIGSFNSADNYSSALGYDSQATGVGSFSAGRGGRVSGNYSAGVGQQVTVSGDSASGIGSYLLVTQANAHAIGRGASAAFPMSPGLPNMLYLGNEADSNEFRVGIGVRSPTGALQVAGSIVGFRFYGDGAGLTNLPGVVPPVQTGQVDSISYAGAVRGAIQFAGDGLTQTGNIFNFRTGIGYIDTRGFTNSGGAVISGPVTLGGANIVTAQYGFAAGRQTTAIGKNGANANGYGTYASGTNGANANGEGSVATGHRGANANGLNTAATGVNGPNANGNNTTASGDNGANANGLDTVASGDDGANANGRGSVASGDLGATANGYGNTASGDYSMAPGGWNNFAIGNGSFAAGVNAVATNIGAFVWSDHNEGSAVGSPADNTFTIRATNGWYSTQDTTEPALVIRGNTHYGDGSGLTNINVSGDGGATGFVFYGMSGSYDPTTRTLGITNAGSGGGITPTSTYGVAIVGASTNAFIVDPGSASNLVLMSSGAGFVPQFRAHPWASSSSVATAVGNLSNATFAQTWASTASVISAANSANATSLNGQAWGASPNVGDFPVYVGVGGWSFTNEVPGGSTGAVTSVSAGTNVVVGAIDLRGTGNVSVTSSEAVNGTVYIDGGLWSQTQDGGEQVLTAAHLRVRSLLVGEGNSLGTGSNNVALVGGATFGNGSRGNVAAGQALSMGAGQNNFGYGTNNTIGGSYSVIGGRANSSSGGGNYVGIMSGFGNLAVGTASFIGAGWYNTNSAGDYAVIPGGIHNRAANYATASGGATNWALAQFSTIPGGGGMTIASTGDYSFAYNAAPTNRQTFGAKQAAAFYVPGNFYVFNGSYAADNSVGISATNSVLIDAGAGTFTTQVWIFVKGIRVQ